MSVRICIPQAIASFGFWFSRHKGVCGTIEICPPKKMLGFRVSLQANPEGYQLQNTEAYPWGSEDEKKTTCAELSDGKCPLAAPAPGFPCPRLRASMGSAQPPINSNAALRLEGSWFSGPVDFKTPQVLRTPTTKCIFAQREHHMLRDPKNRQKKKKGRLANVHRKISSGDIPNSMRCFF